MPVLPSDLLRHSPRSFFFFTNPRISPVSGSIRSLTVTTPIGLPAMLVRMARPKCSLCKRVNTCRIVSVPGADERGAQQLVDRLIVGVLGSANVSIKSMVPATSPFASTMGKRECLDCRASFLSAATSLVNPQRLHTRPRRPLHLAPVGLIAQARAAPWRIVHRSRRRSPRRGGPSRRHVCGARALGPTRRRRAKRRVGSSP